MSETVVTRIVPLTLGWQDLDRSVALDGYPPGTVDRIPIPGFVLERADGGLMLFDTGFDPRADPGEFAAPDLPPPEVILLPEALTAAGFSVDQVEDVVLSHLMIDHAGGLRTLKSGTRAWVQAVEWEYATSSTADKRVYRDQDLEDIQVEVALLDGDAEVWDGVYLFPTPGHCVGHQSALIRLGGRTVLLAADAADLRYNLQNRIAPGLLLHGRDAALDSIDHLNRLAHETDAFVIPGHDPEVWRALPETLT